MDKSQAVMNEARKTILPKAETRLYGARRIFNLNTSSAQQWSTSERWTLAYMQHALGLSGFYRDTTYDEPSRVLLVVPDEIDIRMDLVLTVGIAPAFADIGSAGKGAFARLFAPSAETAHRWQDIADRCEDIYGAGHNDVAFSGNIRPWSSLQAQPGSSVDYRSTYYLGCTGRDGCETDADAAGLLKLLETPRASCLLVHCGKTGPLVPDVLGRANVHLVTVLS